MESSSSAATRRPCFTEGDDGLASVAEISGSQYNHHPPVYSRTFGTVLPKRRGSLRNLNDSLSSRIACSSTTTTTGVSSPRSGYRFYVDARFEENHQPHFLEACFLCQKHLGDNRDIFMYRGDTPFCSEECRQEQIDIDEAKEKNWKIAASMKALRNKKKDAQKSTTASASSSSSSSSPSKNQNYPYRAGTVVAA